MSLQILGRCGSVLQVSLGSSLRWRRFLLLRLLRWLLAFDELVDWDPEDASGDGDVYEYRSYLFEAIEDAVGGEQREDR